MRANLSINQSINQIKQHDLSQRVFATITEQLHFNNPSVIVAKMVILSLMLAWSAVQTAAADSITVGSMRVTALSPVNSMYNESI